MIEKWQRSIRDHPKRPSNDQVMALTMLALRLDDRTHTGFASVQRVSDDAKTSRSTTQRAIRWAREFGYLEQSRRGHRLGNGQRLASEWRMTLPSQGVTGDTLTWQPEAHP